MKKLILDYLEETCKTHQDKIAFADLENELSFSELKEKSRCVASFLLPFTKAGEIVPFYLDKGTLAIIGFIGAVYAGCAYSQINLRYPSSRVQKMLELIQPSVVVTDRAHLQNLSEMTDLRIVVLEDILDTPILTKELQIRRSNLTDRSPLYVNFTSGSTGTPKGVVVSHQNTVEFISSFVSCFSINENDVLANQAPFDFDVSVKDIYSGIFTGARVEIIPTGYFSNPVKLGDFLHDREVTVLIWAVSALCFLTSMGILDYKKPETVRLIMFSGEVMPIKHLKKLKTALPKAVYVNLYGPTEITCNCTYYILDHQFENGDAIPIGVPFPNRKVFLLDENDHLVTEPYAVGELCVAGAGVALGYLRNPEKTRECFCQNPLNDKWYERIYRTGDLIRVSENGDWYYLSRKDFQIKHMGHRIELTEIDSALQTIEDVDRACCQYLEAKGKIIAFISGKANKDFILSELKKSLPDYMIPNIFSFVESMPLNKNGKIDRQALMTSFQNTQ